MVFILKLQLPKSKGEGLGVFKHKQHIITLLFFFLFTVILFWPLFQHPFTTVTDDYDGVFIIWTIRWVQHVITTFPIWSWPTYLYHAPIFAPLPWTYTFSDPFFSAAIIGLPFQFFSSEPILSLTVNTILALVLTALFSYLFVWEVTRQYKASFMTGLVISFGVTHLSFLGHLHVLMIQWIPLALYAWHCFINKQQKRFLLLFFVCFLLQVLNSPFAGYLFLASTWPILLTNQSLHSIRRNWKVIVVTTTLFLVPVGLFYWPFLTASHFYHSVRSINDAAHFALSPGELVSSLRASRLYWVLGFLLVYFSYAWIKKSPKEKLKRLLAFPQLQRNFFLAGLISTVLALGPVLKWSGQTVKIPFPIPLPYAVAYYVLPFFGAFRTPSRWLIASHLCLSFLVALALPKKYFSLLLMSLLTLLIIWEAQPFLHFVILPTTPKYPKVYTAIAQLPAGKVLYLPPYTYDMVNAKQEVYRMLFSTIDQNFLHPMYNGYSGYAPQSRMDEMSWMHKSPFSFLTQKVIRENQIKYIVIQNGQLSSDDQQLATELRQRALYSDSANLIIDSTLFQLSCQN